MVARLGVLISNAGAVPVQEPTQLIDAARERLVLRRLKMAVRGGKEL
jgi:hypothetical protein